MPRTVHATLIAALLVAPAFAVLAKLPPPSDEAKAKAAEAAAKTAWTDKVSAFQLCKAMDRSAAHYRKENKAAKPAVATPPCADPGPFVAPVAAAASAPGATPPATPVQAKK
ncbi:MAG TPA: hypothetical protein VFL86_21730 [Burkholderiaceae bacterium]|nr:hypothetical protein [Burkholderiaceae bacterium]